MTYSDVVSLGPSILAGVAVSIVGGSFLVSLVAKAIAFTGKVSSHGDRYALAVRRINRRWTRIEDYRQ